MQKDLIIDVAPAQVTIALLEDNRLVELNNEQNSTAQGCGLGDVYLGRVRKVMPALNAAFVDIGDNKDAFIHYLDLGLIFKASDYFVRQINTNRDIKTFYSNLRIGPYLEKEGKIEEVLSQGQQIIVQIVKEPISTKGARLTAEISIAGRNIVLIPFSEKVNISQKISSKEEKRRLENLVRSILPKNFGAIIRTAAEGKKAAVLDSELRSLIERWENGCKKLVGAKPPQLLFTEKSKATTILRDLLNDSFTNIEVNDESTYNEIRDYIKSIVPEKEKIVRLYKGNKPILDAFDITRQIKGAFGKVVPIRHGAYLVIEHTEALNVVDVNSGTRIKKGVDQEDNIFEINVNAADEVARQMRLRDLGGIVIIDFIDMDNNENRTKLFKHMQEKMKGDRAKHNILPLSKFGLMQITRQRVRPATEIKVNETCPMCHGTGEIAPSLLADEAVERQLAYYAKEKKLSSFVLKTNPLLEAYLTKKSGLFGKSILQRWKKKYSSSIKVEADSDLTLLQAVWCNKSGEPLE
ncbi:MAG: Rne/Rng family ribonuclease [Bacteroidales bacterium]|nr:Rne/Rng family ribonuclease [Bacteroidales bacterium]